MGKEERKNKVEDAAEKTGETIGKGVKKVVGLAKGIGKGVAKGIEGDKEELESEITLKTLHLKIQINAFQYAVAGCPGHRRIFLP